MPVDLEEYALRLSDPDRYRRLQELKNLRAIEDPMMAENARQTMASQAMGGSLAGAPAAWLGERGYTEHLNRQGRIAQLGAELQDKPFNVVSRRDPSLPIESLLRQAKGMRAGSPEDEDIQERLSKLMRSY